jgi:hypothetical protein
VNFLSPAFLALGVAAAVPLLLHLLRRRVGTRVDFPAVRYLLRAEQENRRTMRLRNLLLMLLRVAIVLLLAVAAARPIGRMIGAGHAPAAIAILIDNSMSSGAVVEGRSMLDRFKSAALAITRDLEPTDNVWLVTADGTIAGGSPASLRDAIAAISPSNADTDLPAALRRAYGLARAASQSARAVVVFTDAQRTSWSSPVAEKGARTIIWSPRTPTPENHSIAFVEARPERWSPRGEVTLRVNGHDSLTYRLTLAGRTFARGTAAPGVDAVIHAAPPERGWLGGSVDLAPDELAADDIRYFAVWIGPAPAVHATSGAGEFVTAALDALTASSRVVGGGTIAIGPAEEIASLPALITAPADPVRVGAANRALERLGVPWRFSMRRAQAIDATLDGIGRVPVAERYDLQAQSGAIADTLGRVANAPWVVAGPRYVLVGSPLAANATGLPVQAGFVPWLSQTIADRLTGEGGQVVAATAGSWVRRPAGADQLERPDGSLVAVADSIRAPANPGVYFFVSAGRRTGAIVVNPPARESQLDRMSAAELQRLIPGAAVIEDGDAVALASPIFVAASTRSLLSTFLVAALVAMLVESLVVTLSAATARRLPGRDAAGEA